LAENFDSLRIPVKEADRGPGPFPYYGASGVVDHVDGYLFDGEYVLVAEDGENLRTQQTPIAFMAKGRFWVNNHAHILRANSRNDTRFLMYALRHVDIRSFLTGSTMPKLTQASLNRVPIPAPPLSVQRAIAHILSSLDDKIDLNRRINETLESLARAIFDERFSNAFSDATIGDLADIQRTSVTPENHPDEWFDHYSLPAFDEGRRPARELGSAIKSNKFAVEPGAVLVSKLNPSIPRVWYPRVGSERRSIASTEFQVMRSLESSSPEFLYCTLRSEPVREHLIGLASGTSNSHQRVKPDDLLGTPAPRPRAGDLERFTQTTRPMFSCINTVLEESRTLAALRDVLLPMLLSGELRVPEAERVVEAAT
jgi:type I restriction enzyme S subunit